MMQPIPNFTSRARTTARKRLMVISAKGGVGKSTVTVNLAAALLARGKSVGIFDADIHGPNIPALLGVTQGRDLKMGANTEAMLPVQVKPGAMDLRPLKPVERYGIKLMSLGLLVGGAQTISPHPGEIGNLMRVLLMRVDWKDQARNPADVLLLDMPPGTGEPLHTLLNETIIDAALIVTTREMLAHMDNARLIALLNDYGVPMLGVVENMAYLICPNCGEQIELYPAPAADQPAYTGLPILASLPFHPHLIRQNRHAAPLPLSDEASPAKDALLALADAVIGRL
jgi:ATP-binding protein involved in chromosome partitioning